MSEQLTEENLLSDPVFSNKCFNLLQKYRDCLTQFTNRCICEQNIQNEHNFNLLEEEFRNIYPKKIIILAKPEVKPNNNVKSEEFDEEVVEEVDEIVDESNDKDFDPEMTDESDNNSSGGDSDEEFIPKKITKTANNRKTKAATNGPKRKRKKYVYFNFVCDWIGCDRKYSKKDDLMAHISSCHTKEKPFKCDICSKTFSIEKFLKNHQKNYHLIVKTPKSEKVVVQTKSFVCDVDDCGKTFFSTSNLKKHQSTVHSTEKPYVCEWPGCSAAYKIKESLINHRAIHSDERKFKCDIEGCSKTFQTKWNYYSHMKSHRQQADPEKGRKHPCDWPGCQFSGKNKQDLTIHMNRHMNIKPYKCLAIGCQMSYFTSYELKQHKIKVHEVLNESDREFKCHIEGCQKRYAVERDLKRHLRRHDRIYACSWPECGQTYAAKQLLSDHMDRHMNVKSFHCHFVGCAKSFFSKTNYEGHMKKMHKYNCHKGKLIDELDQQPAPS